MTPTSFFAFLLLLTALATSTSSIPSKSQRFITNLIHSDSVLSPFYNPNDTIEDRAKRSLTSSYLRSAHFQYRTNDQLEGPSTDLYPSSAGFLVKIPMGQPPIPQYLLIDSGSPLAWVECAMCQNCEKSHGPVYDHRMSSTYVQSKCPCYRPKSFCNWHEHSCEFGMSYGDGTTVLGYMGTERVIIESLQGPNSSWDIPLGCVFSIPVKVGLHYQGILGLADHTLSITNQIRRFSYCVGNLGDPLYGSNFFILDGDKYNKSFSSSTPYTLNDDGAYQVKLDGVSIGDRKINIDPNVFGKQFIIDSGTPYTMLPPAAYYAIREAVSSLSFWGLFRKVKYTGNLSWKLCYSGKLTNSFFQKSMPTVTFHFAEGADLVVDPTGTFYQAKANEICLGMVPVEGAFIIGIMVQQFHNVVYELEEKRIYFDPMDCSWLIYN
ncbi:unnamed protein product [Dovyalis caffra]|uniref:Peptidase A1 domain-containing protein n=1 Tax=Dovyalis caffra TaxID=77055 RepID=A0AAV1RUL3_9ROSI|nr:unnamed protein product [Dovyalis caffra]